MKVSSIALERRGFLAVALAVASQQLAPASAKYGEFANIAADGSSTLASGDSDNKCLFATPGTGICQVYESSDPKIWASPDTAKALEKLVSAAKALDSLSESIAGKKWTAISQALGASRDLRESVGFLTSQADDPKAAAQAKKVFQALDGIAVAVQKKDSSIATLYFDKYSAAMPELIKMLS